MRMRIALSALALVVALALPTAASANWYISHADAVYGAQDAMSPYIEGFTGAGTGAKFQVIGPSCRPYYAARERRGNRWHRWTCTWSGIVDDTDHAYGRVYQCTSAIYRVRGSRTAACQSFQTVARLSSLIIWSQPSAACSRRKPWICR